MLKCLMHVGSVNALKTAMIQPHYLSVDGFSMSYHADTLYGMDIWDDDSILWEDQF